MPTSTHRHSRCLETLITVIVATVLAGFGTVCGAQEKSASFVKSAKENRMEDFQRLLKQGANVNASDERGYTALIWVAGRGNLNAAQKLLDAGADINAKTVDNVTALIRAASWGHFEVVKLLVARGADLNVKGKDGWTATQAASLFGHEEIKQFLVQHGAKEK